MPNIEFPVHVTPTGGTMIADDYGRVIAIATDWRHASEIVSALNARNTSRLVDGLDCVSWVKKRRNDTGCTLKAAKDEWDGLVGSAR